MTTGGRGSRTAAELARDVRQALRALRREPVLVAGVVLTFALAIGANAAMFGLVARLMLAPPPGVAEPGRVVHVRLRFADEGHGAYVASTTSYPAFRALREARAAFDAVTATAPDTLLVGGRESLERLAVLGASGDYFAALGVTPALGRLLGPADDLLPRGSAVLVLGHAYWQRAFDGDPAVLGRELVVDGQPFVVVGVAPRGFNGVGLGAVDAYLPLAAALRSRGEGWIGEPRMNLVSIAARLRDGVAPAAAAQRATLALRGEWAAAGRESPPSVELASVVPGRESRESPQARIALWLAAVSLVVLLIATANAGTLLVLRAARRRREIAVRLALGAGRARLARQLLAESVLLAAGGAAAGLLLSRWLGDVVRVTLLPQLAPGESVVHRGVLAASVLAACAAGVAAGLAPVAQAGRTDLARQLRAGGGHGVSTRLAFQGVLVRVQVALCTLLLVGAGLFVRSLQRVQAQDLGFSADRLLHVTLEFRGYASGVERDLAYADALRRLRALPVVARATEVQGIPFGPHHIPPFAVPGMAEPPNVGGQIPIMYAATPEYLDLMDVRIVAGRPIEAHDARGAPLVVLVNETMARAVWPGRSPLGACVRVGFASWPPAGEGNPADGSPCRTVVGVVRDSRARSLRPERDEDRLMQYYVPFAQLPDSPGGDGAFVMGLMARVHGDADRAAGLVRRAIHATSALPVYAHARHYQDLIDPQLRSWRLGATLFSAFGALAVAIAAVGLFGVVSYLVTQRTQEMGIRLALGGTRPSVARLVLADALRLVGAGVLAGLAIALAAGPAVAPLLFQLSPRDPASLALAGLALLLVALGAAAWPAWRAGRVPPATALRADG